jgi:hypothetical protein
MKFSQICVSGVLFLSFEKSSPERMLFKDETQYINSVSNNGNFIPVPYGNS